MSGPQAADPAVRLADALAQWRLLLGAQGVRDDEATLSAYACSTASWSTRPAAVLQPQTRADVECLVRIAAALGIALYPISTGRNWGYGDACAATPGQVIVDLSGMNRIREVNATLAYVVIEPGVTQWQLSQYLLSENLPLWMDSTGAGPDTSLIGNLLERGFGHSPYGNRFQHVCGMEIVLADGAVLQTGFGHFSASRNSRVFPYGPGPWLDGMFTQSNFGIVTSLGLWLMPKTDSVQHFLCRVERHADIAPVVDALRPLRLDGTLRSIVHIGNDLRVLSGGSTYPHERAGNVAPLPPVLRQQLRREAGVGAWTVSGALYGSACQVACARRAVRQALRHTGARPAFVDQRKLALAGWIAGLLGERRAGRTLRAKVALGRALFDLNQGIPNGRFLAGAYWRRRGGLPPGFPTGANPARDNCGLLWVSPVLPLCGADLLQVHALAEPIYDRHGFDLFATFSMISERALGGVLSVAYDKDDPDETARAMQCYRQLFDTVMQAGYIPYRVGLQSMADLDRGGDCFWRVAATLKAALDPHGIIAPGRYQPPASG